MPTPESAEAPTYKAQQAPDGTWTIYDVPIFAVHVDDRGAKPISFSVKWLNKALERGKVRHAEGYYPPLHISHHGEDGVEAAGKVRLTEIRDHPHGGREIPTLFADLVGVRTDVFQRIRKGELSYRSVEILDVDSPEIDSLALLDDQVPYFRFPLLKIGSEKRAAASPVLAYSAAGSRASLLFSFEAPMKRRYQDEEEPETMETPPEEAPEWAKAFLDVLGKIAEAVGVEYQAEEEDKEKEEESASEKAAAPPPPAPEPPSPDAEPLQVGVTVAEEMRAEAQQDAMAATVAALQAEVETLKKDRRIEQRAADMRAKGMDQDHVAKFRQLADARGIHAASCYADAMETSRPMPPPPGFTGELAPPRGGVDAPEVMKYAQRGPEVLEVARGHARAYADASPIPQMDLSEWLEIQMDTDAYFAASRAGAGRG